MNERVAPPALWIACTVVALIALGHRAALFLLHRADLDALIAANSGWYTYQQLPLEMLRDHLFRSLLYLQQNPPLSNLIMGIVVKLAPWPFGVAYVMIALHALGSILTALVLLHLLSVLYPGRVVLWTVFGVLFVLNADLVVLEYNSLGQTLYEAVTMLLVLATVDLLVGFRRDGRSWQATAAGIATGLLALTRATWCLFALPGLALVAVLAPLRRGRAVVAYLVPVLVLQGGWAVKNWAVYGVLSPFTSTMGGASAAAGLHNAGFREEMHRFVQERVTAENGYADWEVAIAHGDPAGLGRIPVELRERDREIERAMGFPNTYLNTLTWRAFTEWSQGVFFAFAFQHPRIMLVKWWRGYTIFWQPIASYGRQFVALFAGGGHIPNGLDVPDVARQLLAGTLPGTHDL
jgi:hypothetical protein